MHPIAIILLIACSHQASIEHDFTATSEYSVRRIQGFEVRIEPEVLEHADQATEAIREITKQIKAMCRDLPDDKVELLRKVTIWLDYDTNKTGVAVFHPNRQWLVDNGRNPDKAGCVEISCVRNFIRASRRTQPCVVMHEMAHAFHHHYLSFSNAEIRDVFRQTKLSKLYDNIEYVHRDGRPAYALTNHKEYFAETTEAYFGRNDFYPYNRRDLLQHDRVSFALMQRMWERPAPERKPK